MSEIHNIISCTLLVAALVAFIVLLLNKTGLRDKWRDWFDAHESPLIAKMLDCDFCLCFWLTCLCTIAFAITDPWLLVLPVTATPIARFLQI